MQVITTVSELRAARASLRGDVALVPTMGALHAGHAALIEHAQTLAPNVMVSIFVNPTQFAPHEDFDRYPRPIEQDLTLCRKLGVQIVFNPTPEQMYPPQRIATQLTVPALVADLEGACRPGHFDGVCRVCCKLFNICQPQVAVFGRKDYQQLRVISAMVEDLDLPLRIEPMDTVREEDGLAMSSRNRYLDAEQRPRAVGLYKALCQARAMVEQAEETDPAAVEEAMRHVLQTHQLEIEYAVLRHPLTLRPLDVIDPSLTSGVVALIAARLGATRLIDNMLLG